MADTGFIVPTASSNTGAGSTGTSPTITLSGSAANVQSSDNTYDTIAHGSGSNTSNYIHYTGFNTSSIPSGSTINGIELIIERKGSAANRGRDEVIQLVIGGSHVGTNKAVTGTLYPTTDTDSATYGGAADLWGNTITYADVVTNASTFGVAVKTSNGAAGSVTISIDYIRMRITYTAATGDVSPDVPAVSGTGSVGSVTVTGDSNVTPTGNSGTGSVGTITPQLDVSASITGNSGAGSVGDFTITGDANVTPPAGVGTATAGLADATGDSSVTITGVSGTGSVGDPTVAITGDISVTLDGVTGTGTPGTADATGDASVTPLGVSATCSAGVADATGDSPVSITGVTGTVSPGTVVATGDANVTPAAVVGTGSPGTPTITGDANVTPDAAVGTGTAGIADATTTGDVMVAVGGVSATGSAADIDAQGTGTAPPALVDLGGGGKSTGKPFDVFSRPVLNIHRYDPTFEAHHQDRQRISAALEAFDSKDTAAVPARLERRHQATSTALGNKLILQALEAIMREAAADMAAQRTAQLRRDDEAFLIMMAA